jgi:signal transduction histidine kinase
MPHSATPFGFESCVLSRTTSILAYWDRKLICRYANTAYADWFGHPVTGIVGIHLRDLLGPQGFDQVHPYILGKLAGTGCPLESEGVASFGKRYGMTHYRPDTINNVVVGYIAEIHETTPMERAQRLGRIGTWHLDLESEQMTWSPELYRIFEMDPTAPPPALEAHLAVYPPESRRRAEQVLETARTEGRPYEIELEFQRRDGSTGWIEARGAAERDSRQAIRCLYGTAQDVSARHLDFDRLRRQMTSMKLATDAAQLGIWRWDLESDEVVWENEWPLAILGIPMIAACARAGPLAKEFLTAEQDDELYYVIRKSICREAGFRFVGQIKRRGDGELRWIELIGGPQNAATLIGTIMDVTDRVEAEENLRRAAEELSELDARKNDFLATLGHELRNCLSPLQTAVHAIGLGATGCISIKQHEVMSRQIKHLGRLIDDLYDIRKISTGEIQLEIQQVSLHQVVSEAIEMCRCLVERSRHTLHYHIVDEKIEVQGDPVRLAQIFSNIIGNAVKFTPPSGSIDIRIEMEEESAVVRISDNGIGMTEQELLAVFGLYARANDRNCRASDGLGIGLHLVRTLTELQGGKVDAYSDGPGKGTTLIVRLSAAA